MRRKFAFLLGLAILTVAAPVWAWNQAGHMTHAAIAFAVLKKESPGTIEKVVALLKKHPHYEESWARRIRELEEKKPGVTQEEKDLYLFMQAARWADDIRGD